MQTSFGAAIDSLKAAIEALLAKYAHYGSGVLRLEVSSHTSLHAHISIGICANNIISTCCASWQLDMNLTCLPTLQTPTCDLSVSKCHVSSKLIGADRAVSKACKVSSKDGSCCILLGY